MPNIAVLSPELVNRIAAGECVERPASVVKELVENAIDAGATGIDITINDGGRGLIEVVDDGSGMEAADLRLCIQPHATSKIRDDEDLFHIHSMGFRGEALPSIGSVARLQITSRPRVNQAAAGEAAGGPSAGNTDIAHTLRVEGGVVSKIEPVGAPPGTSVAVRDLFYCVPARRKFLKTNQTEMGHITEQLARLALAHPEIRFSLRNERRKTHALPATGDRVQRIADFYGRELADVLLPIRREGNGILIEGCVAPPKESRGSGKWEYTFVNGRYVRDRFVSHAIKAAYRSLIDPSRYPVTFLFITIDPAQIDVNVHPTKAEIRWRDSNYVHSQVLAALRDKFLGTNLDRTLRTDGGDERYRDRVRAAMTDFFKGTKGSRGQGIEASHGATRPRSHEGDEGKHEGTEALRHEEGAPAGRGDQHAPFADPIAIPAQATAPTNRATENESHQRDPRSEISSPRSQISNPESPIPNSPSPIPNPQSIGPSTPRSLDPSTPRPLAPSTPRPLDPSAPRPLDPSAPRPLDPSTPRSLDPSAPRPLAPRALQVHNMYIISETDDGLMIVDQHALHERILYEEYKARIADRTLESQRLLLPEVVTVAPDRIEALETHADLLARMGIELTPSGPTSVTLHAFPSLLDRIDRRKFVRDLLDTLAETGARPDPEILLHNLLDMMACKAAVKFGDALTPGEVDALLARRETAERSSNCPHGRPTTLHLSLRDLERQFKRR
jgi:DNA mismatch repair protein MutL